MPSAVVEEGNSDMAKADVCLTPAIDSNMPCNARKRIHCWGSSPGLAAASPRKKPDVEDVAQSRWQEGCTGEAMDNDTFSDDEFLSSKAESEFTRGSHTGGAGGVSSADSRFPSVELDGCGQEEEVCEMRAECRAPGLETSREPEEDDTGNPGEDFNPCTPDKEMRPRRIKTAVPNSPVSNVRSLLSTGLLEGLSVKYCFDKHKVEIPGIIRDLGYLCGCSSCNYTKVLSAVEFERHSGVASKNQNNHIFLKNGKTLYNVVKVLAKFRLDSLGDVIESVIGCPPNWKCYKAWKESFQIENREDQDANQNLDRQRRPQPKSHNNSQSITSFPECIQESYIGSDLKSEIHATPITDNDIFKTSYHGCSQESQNISSLNYVRQELPHEEKHVSSLPVRLQKYPPEERNIVSHTSKGRTRATRMSRSPDLHCTQDATLLPNMQPNSSAEVCVKKRDNDFHRLVFMGNGLPDGTELAYCIKGQKVLEGYKLGNGIACNCCHREMSPSQFEAHAGWAARRQPYRHIFTSNGISLHDLSLSLSNGQHLTAIRCDDECSVCGDGGELILCARCPKAFHIVCLGLDHTPDGEWYCTYCKDDVLSGVVSTDAQMTIRVRRVIVAPTLETGCCSICRSSNFSRSDSFNDETVLICDQCEREYHVGCLRNSGICDLQDLPEGDWFCCSNCVALHASLQNIISNGTNIVPEVLSNQLEMKIQEKGLMNESTFDVRWQLLSGKIRSSENKFLLSKAFEIFRNGFDPIVERSGRDLIPAIVYGRNMGGHELGGMYCVILTMKSVPVSAAILRVFGKEAAEMPLAATAHNRRGKGYFGCLFSCIEMLLRDLNVETLILPATENAETMWIHKFRFKRMAEERFQRFARVLPIMMFRGTKMLEKPVLPASCLVEQAP